ncbi:MAG: biotin/lipoyl-binding protein [Solirubrobacterales bacterium]
MKKKSRLSRLPLPRRPLEWGLTILAVALVVIAITSLGSSSSSSSAATKRTSTVSKGVVQSTVSGNGTLEPAQEVELSFGASGEVTAVYVKAGEKVKKGEVLAEVDSSSARATLASDKAALLEAEEAVESAEEAEEEAEEEEEENEETAYTGGATTEFVGLMSESGTSTTSKEGESTSTEESSTEGTTSEETTKEEESSTSGSSKSKESSSGSSKSSSSSASASEETSAAEEETSTEASSSETSASESTAATSGGGSSVSLPTAEANLRQAQLTVKSARQEVRETTLRAPISGTIASISGSVGETVSGGSSSGGTSEASSGGASGGESSSFIVLAQLHRLKMEVSFSESDIGKVRKGQTATVSIDSMEGTELSGEVTKVSVLPSESSSSSVVEYPATILLTQSAKGLRSGMSASAEVVVEQVKNAVTVPTEAISSAGSGKTVTVEENGKEVTKTIKTGLEGDETTEVISGLEAGATLILPEVTVATSTESSGSKEEESSSGLPSGGTSGGFSGGPPSGGGFGGGAP